MEYDWLGFGYAALVAAGGVVGYAKAGSVPSLAAGLLFGGLAGLGAYQQSKDPKNVWLSLAAPCPFTCTNVVSGGRTSCPQPGGICARAWYQILKPGLNPELVEMQKQNLDSISRIPFGLSDAKQHEALEKVASGTLSTVMGMRFYNSRKAMPGIIAGASLLMVGRLGLQMMEKPIKP